MSFFNSVKKACQCIMQGASEPKETANESSKRYKNLRWKRISVSSRTSSSSDDATRQRREDALRERGLLPPLQATSSAHGRELQWDVRTLVEEAGTGNEVQDDKIRHEEEARPVTRHVLEWLAEVDTHRGYNGGEIDLVEMNSSRAEGSDIPGDVVSPLLDGTPDCCHSVCSGECRSNDTEYATPSSPSHSEHSSLTCAADFSSAVGKWSTEGLLIDIPISRPVLDITIHSHGTIMVETSHIEDDESRRLTELAYLA
ncbi:hypothetical protein IW261DRAFT_868962 [Armillaria novae-zelandiae]|uniref:Uncharacterized protein n=1 Tax=Armillaria novae-zelandiae TaxID=153914 RepID=A0AA39UMK1_9AGAR|nr:hypothetical protein IW261DRAFT_868962 [Armillaria novae-zelandiae]